MFLTVSLWSSLKNRWSFPPELFCRPEMSRAAPVMDLLQNRAMLGPPRGDASQLKPTRNKRRQIDTELTSAGNLRQREEFSSQDVWLSLLSVSLSALNDLVTGGFYCERVAGNETCLRNSQSNPAVSGQTGSSRTAAVDLLLLLWVWWDVGSDELQILSSRTKDPKYTRKLDISSQTWTDV